MNTKLSPQAQYHRNQRQAGLVRLATWVPDSRRADFWDAVDLLYARWKRDGLIEEKAAQKGRPREK